MAYRYNEKTGEFEDIPQGPAQRRNSQPSISDIPSIEELNRVTTRQHTWGNSRVPHVPTRISTNHINTTPVTSPQSHQTSKSDGFLSTLGGIILGIMPYVIGVLLAATCS